MQKGCRNYGTLEITLTFFIAYAYMFKGRFDIAQCN